jgi:hypothetical protein
MPHPALVPVDGNGLHNGAVLVCTPRFTEISAGNCYEHLKYIPLII